MSDACATRRLPIGRTRLVAPVGGSPRPTVVSAASRRLPSGARFESGRGADGIVYAIGLLYRCSGDGNSSLASGEQQDTLSATALPYERPVNLPTVWETAEAGHWDCVGTHSSWQKARRSTSSGKMLWRDCEGVLSYQQNAAWSIFHARAVVTTSLRAGKHC